ncbi:tetraspanin-3-like [Saccoglossus kowalevskii]|uniref:Tetraspanin n=1 Tax=Saccoglossus kowalevskii TaxID=10224 RepID=A0ABM0GS79_SACKO|nr:PREDICTED: tetraspanin-3-like [Saccoglossus kowalevskii]
MGVCSVTAKCTMVILAVIFWAAAAGLGYVGIHVFVTYGNYEDITKSYYTLIPAGIILGAAVFLLITGLVGCCGACIESKCLLGTFFTLILLILLLEITGAVLGFVYHGEVKKNIREGMDDAIHNYNGNNDSAGSGSVDYMQEELKCCGVYNYTDWKDTDYFKKTKTVPTSCCKNTTDCTGSLAPTETDKLYQDGCFVKLTDIFQDNLKYIAVAACVLAIIMLIGMIFSCMLICSRKEVPYVSLQGEYA